jgi:uncharacterized protein
MQAKLSYFFAVAILLTAGSTSFADTKSHRKAAEDMLDVIGVETQLQSAIDQTLDMQIKANPQIAPFKGAMKKFFLKYMSWSSLKDDIVSIYVETFTEQELNEIKAFYLTPAGKKLASKMPELMGKGMELGVKRVQEHQDELRQMIQEEAAKEK